jgi:regulator of cell morphogenesis and NO signaling
VTTIQATPPAPITADVLLGDLVAEVPSRANVFDHVRMSYSTGGKRTLAQAAADHELDVDELIRAVEAHDREGELNAMDWSRVPPSRLVDQLDREHTTFMGELYLPAQGVLERISLREGPNHDALVPLCDRFTALENTFVNHFDDEEHGIFMACRGVDEDGLGSQELASIDISQVAADHVAIVAELDEIREIIESMEIDEDGSEDWKQFQLAFASMERALRRHMHCEEYILPRSVALANA